MSELGVQLYRSFSRIFRRLNRLHQVHGIEMAQELCHFPRILGNETNQLLKPYFSTELPLTLIMPNSQEIVLNNQQSCFALCFQVLRQLNFRLAQLQEADYSKRSEGVDFYVGQVFQHKKYQYWGIIAGYDIICQQNAAWKERMGVNQLENGENQPFYNALVVQNGKLCCFYIAQENVELNLNSVQPIQHEDIEASFLEYDTELGCFELNDDMKKMYPDDAYWFYVQKQYLPGNGIIEEAPC